MKIPSMLISSTCLWCVAVAAPADEAFTPEVDNFFGSNLRDVYEEAISSSVLDFTHQPTMSPTPAPTAAPSTRRER